MPSESALPSIAEVIGPVVAGVSAERQPLLIALAERMAAARYRVWAESAGWSARKGDLLACAEREEAIAARVEGLYPDAAAIQAELRAEHPELDALSRSIFDERPLPDQFAIQAGGERLGAATWRSFAAAAEADAERVFLECAELEEASAEVLEDILGISP